MSWVIGNPYPLKRNAGKSFIGSYVLGMGFVLKDEEAESIIAKDARNRQVLFPYLNGEDLNNDPEQKPSRWVINFFDWPEEKARTYPDCYSIIEKMVKPERQRWKLDENGREIIGTFALRKPLPQKWWIYGEKRPALYETISQLDQVMVLTRVSKYVVVEMVNSKQVFTEKIVVKTFQDPFYFCILQSTIYNEWAWKYSSTLRGGTINYSPSVCFDTFPFPEIKTENNLNEAGISFYTQRQKIMKNARLGLTRLYNQVHNSSLSLVDDPSNLNPAVFLKKYGKDSLSLRTHLESFTAISYNDVVTEIKELRKRQIQMDMAVMEAYGWTDISLKHNFYAMDYLPEGDRLRFSIDPIASREILKRLLKLNEQIHLIEPTDKKKILETDSDEIEGKINNTLTLF